MAAADYYDIVGSAMELERYLDEDGESRSAYRSVPETVAKVRRLRVKRLIDRTRGAWPQSWRARWGTAFCIAGEVVMLEGLDVVH